VKTISIEELHTPTGPWVRVARTQTIIITDRDRKVSMAQPYKAPDQPITKNFLVERLKRMPSSPIDSTRFISEERDDR
jgi:hypothetical protein